MKITQHYTNIISQEQITSWRQPESSESSSTKHSKQSVSQVRNLDDNHDDLSDKFNDSDRDDNFSNDDDLDRDSSPKHQLSNRLENPQHSNLKIESDDNHSTTESNHDDSPKAFKGLPNSKPLTRSKRRENDTMQSTKRRIGGRANSPATSSYSQQQRQNSSAGSNIILGDLNDGNSEMIGSKEKKCKTNGKTSRENLDAVLASSQKRKFSDKDDDDEDAHENASSDGNKNDVKGSENDKDQQLGSDDEDEKSSAKNQVDDEDDTLKRDAENRTLNGGLPVGKDRRLKEKMKNVVGDDDDDDEDGVDDGLDGDNDDGDDEDDDEEEQRSETNESVTINTTTSGSNSNKKGDTGDPLSALETMVEKSFDPRMRPGVATGGILQRLGIDEEVCPPWQHINYANWYAAAAYGHPMAAALLAAGINLQNGIKLSKNVDPKKSDDCG